MALKRPAVLLVALASSACDPVSSLRTTARGSHAVDHACALQVTEVEFRGEHVRGEPDHNRIVVAFSPDGTMTLAPTAPGKGELTAESNWIRRPTPDELARLEGAQRRALQAILDRCGQPGPASLTCRYSRGPGKPVAGETCFGPPRSR